LAKKGANTKKRPIPTNDGKVRTIRKHTHEPQSHTNA
jgi:hypothetical protein